MLKLIRYFIFKLIYGKIDKVIKFKKNKKISSKKVSFSDRYKYNFYKIKNGRVYSDTINNTAYLIGNSLIKEPSYQYKLKKNLQIVNGNILDNFVLRNGTPKILRNINGSVFSLLSGGAAKNNYWHWIFDSLPKIAILEKLNIKKPDFYLIPSLKKKYQLETLLNLNIPYEKLLDGEKYKHIKCNHLLTVDHPYVFNNNPSSSIINIPFWIIKWLRRKYKKNKSNSKNLSKKIYINRETDSEISNRMIINNDEVKNLLKNKGFEILTLANYSFRDQVCIFKNAEFIVGLHGAGFTNLIFSRPKTKVIELCTRHSGNIFSNLGKTCHLNYKKLIDGSSKPNKHQDNHVMVDLEKLKKLIST